MNFKIRLKQEKVKHKDIAEFLGVSYNKVTRMVNDPGRYITLDKAFQIRDRFFPGIPLDEVFGEGQKVFRKRDHFLPEIPLSKNRTDALRALLIGALGILDDGHEEK